jgi:hypothetical protein
MRTLVVLSIEHDPSDIPEEWNWTELADHPGPVGVAAYGRVDEISTSRTVSAIRQLLEADHATTDEMPGVEIYTGDDGAAVVDIDTATLEDGTPLRIWLNDHRLFNADPEQP